MNGEYTIRPRTELQWLAVDLDGTIAEPVWHPGQVSCSVGVPIPQNVSKLVAATMDGWKVVIHTSRPWADYELIESWLRYHEIPFSRIVCGKLLAHRYVDDRAVHSEAEKWI